MQSLCTLAIFVQGLWTEDECDVSLRGRESEVAARFREPLYLPNREDATKPWRRQLPRQSCRCALDLVVELEVRER